MSHCMLVAVALAPLLMLWCGAADGAPFLGLLSLLAGGSNGTSLLSSLLTSHLEAKLSALAVLSDLIAFATNGTLG